MTIENKIGAKYGSDPYSPGDDSNPAYPDVGNSWAGNAFQIPEINVEAVNALVQEYVDQKMQQYPIPGPKTISIPGNVPGAPNEVMTIPSPKAEIEEGYFEEGQLVAQLAIRIARIMFATHLVERHGGTSRNPEDFGNFTDLVHPNYYDYNQ